MRQRGWRTGMKKLGVVGLAKRASGSSAGAGARRGGGSASVWVAGVVAAAMAVLLAGCRPAAENPSSGGPGASEHPLREMKWAMRQGELNEAWAYREQVLAEHSDNPEVVATVARLAHDLKKPQVAADLLVEACRAESFRHSSRVQQAMIALIGVGRLFDGMAMLEEALQHQPDQHETRRWLYDFYMGTENRLRGIPHGRYLIRQRQFDLQLLMSLSNTERRTQDTEPLVKMAERNPEDDRPLVGLAKAKFDLGELEESIRILREILDQHPEFVTAQALLCQSLAAADQHQELKELLPELRPAVRQNPLYWIALGDWARSRERHDEAARAYWEAAQRDPDVLDAWSKLSMSLQRIGDAEASRPVEIPGDVRRAVAERASQLSQFNQSKNRFDRTGSISRKIALEIVESLRQLGRLWEAEAWAAIATTLPEDDTAPVEQVRQSIVASLQRTTPWQITEGHREFDLDLTELSLPEIAGVSRQHAGEKSPEQNQPGEADESGPGDQPSDAVGLRLINEAPQRGLSFFGRTADDLDQPGISLHETLGCGGGSIDFDLDGWTDLYLVAAGGTPPKHDSAANTLWRNLQGNFADVTGASDTGDTGFGQGAAVGDVNEDGFPDVLVLNYGPNTLLINNGDGTFSDDSERLNEPQPNTDWSTSGAIADVDGDGLSDLVVVNYCAGLEPSTRECPAEGFDVARSCTPMMFPGCPDRFLRAEADGSFSDQTKAWSATPEVLGRGLGITAGAFDSGAGVDLLIANDMTNNHYWSRAERDGDFALSESAMLRGLAGDARSLAQGSMGIATADMNGDGGVDFYVTNFHQEYNTYHQQRGDGLWQDQTSRVGLADPTMLLVGFGTEAVDLDHDGTLELVVTNGHVDIFSRNDERAVYAHPMQVFRRESDGTYGSVGQSMAGEYVSVPHVGRALWTLDANRDGRVDFAVTHQTEPVALLVNQSETQGAWLGLRLRGTRSARDAIGAVVEVQAGERRWTHHQTAGSGYMCSNEPDFTLGLGEFSGDCQVTVTWPDGRKEVFPDLSPGARWLLVEASGAPFRLGE